MITRVRKFYPKPLIEKYPPSRPCSCEICRGYCARPGWWMVDEAERVIFYHHERCELFGTGLQPLECRFCHHDRPGRGIQCHADLERDWDTPDGRGLVVWWSKLTGFWERMVLGRRR